MCARSLYNDIASAARTSSDRFAIFHRRCCGQDGCVPGSPKLPSQCSIRLVELCGFRLNHHSIFACEELLSTRTPGVTKVLQYTGTMAKVCVADWAATVRDIQSDIRLNLMFCLCVGC